MRIGTAAKKEDGSIACGIVIKVVDREKWITISKIAVPLKARATMALVFNLRFWTCSSKRK